MQSYAGGDGMLTHLDLFSGIGGFAMGFRNAVVPQIPEFFGRLILESEKRDRRMDCG